jgi:hypothetical protein
VIAPTPVVDLEQACDAFIYVLLGSEFANVLAAEHASQPVKDVAIRFPEVGYIDEVPTLDGFPSVELAIGPTDFQEAGTGIQATHEINVQWTVNGDDSQKMARELMRLTAATVKFLSKSNGSLMPYVGGYFWANRVDRGPTSGATDRARNGGQPFVKSASVRVMWNAVGY